jgi:Amt family ammonium transporter
MTAEHDAMVKDMDNLWLILGAVLVLFMHAGFSLLEVGAVARKNTKSILAKNLMLPCIGAIAWYFVVSNTSIKAVPARV